MCNLTLQALTLAAFSLSQITVAADEQGIARCAHEMVAFDGLNPPLTYATIHGNTDSHIELHPRHPVVTSLQGIVRSRTRQRS